MKFGVSKEEIAMRIAAPSLKHQSSPYLKLVFFWMKFGISKGGDCDANSSSEIKTWLDLFKARNIFLDEIWGF